MERPIVRTTQLAASLLVVSSLATATSTLADQPQPTPAFPGQTHAPPPSQPFNKLPRPSRTSSPAPWSLAFLPDGNFLITERRDDAHRQARRRRLGADRRRAACQVGRRARPARRRPRSRLRARTACSTSPTSRRRPVRRRRPGRSSSSTNDVWTKSLAERRTMKIGMERVARAPPE